MLLFSCDTVILGIKAILETCYLYKPVLTTVLWVFSVCEMQNHEVNCGQSFEVHIKIFKSLSGQKKYGLVQFLKSVIHILCRICAIMPFLFRLLDFQHGGISSHFDFIIHWNCRFLDLTFSIMSLWAAWLTPGSWCVYRIGVFLLGLCGWPLTCLLIPIIQISDQWSQNAPCLSLL